MILTVDSHPVFAYTGTRPLDPARPSIVFIHGAANDHSVFALQSRWFAHHGWNALAVDLPGHGRSAGQALGSIEALAEWVLRLLDAAGIDRAAIAGHSMGSLVAIEAAGRHPARVAAIALLGSSLPMPVTEELLAAARADDHAAFDMLNIWGHVHATGGSPIPGMWLQGLHNRLLERAAPGVLATDLAACNAYEAGLESAARVECPALLVLGRRDLLVPPRNAQALGKALRRSRTVVLAGCGHSMMAEQPDAVLDALIDFTRPLAAAHV